MAVIFLLLPPTATNALARLLHLDTAFPAEHLVNQNYGKLGPSSEKNY
jgi:hypothetical protein